MRRAVIVTCLVMTGMLGCSSTRVTGRVSAAVVETPTRPAAAAQRTRPVTRPLWWRVSPGLVMAYAPEGATLYRDGGLTRLVYHVGPWAGKLRVTQYCGWPESTIEIEYADGRRETLVVPNVPCGGGR